MPVLTDRPSSAVAAPDTNGFASHDYAGWSFAARIGERLQNAGVPHCAWKANPKIARFERGEGDFDLLVTRRSVRDVISALAPIGFRLALPAVGVGAPAVFSLVAPHPTNHTLLHLHLHSQLLLGSATTDQYRLPIERALLAQTTREDGIRVPSASWKWLLHVLHVTLRHSPHAVFSRREPAWIRALDAHHAELESATSSDATARLLSAHLPMIPLALFERCVAGLRPGHSSWERAATASALRYALRSLRRGSVWSGTVRRVANRTRQWMSNGSGTVGGGAARPAAGGVVVGLYGGDGSGKSTCAQALAEWLGAVFATRHLHLGRPTRGLFTLAVGGALRATRAVRDRLAIPGFQRLVEHLELARVLGTALDRRRAHRIAHRHAAAGGIAICDRHPLRGFDPHAGPSGATGAARVADSRLATWMRDKERDLYARLAEPDLTFVLRLSPDVAVIRKPQEPAEYVRKRAEFVWTGNWDRPGMRLINAERPLREVLRELRTVIWEVL